MALRFLSSTDTAIALAVLDGTLRVSAEAGRFGAYASISDDFGLIEVAETFSAAQLRVAEIEAAIEERAH